jgi:hypothetical protein
VNSSFEFSHLRSRTALAVFIVFGSSVAGYLFYVFRYLDARFWVTAVYASLIIAAFLALAVLQRKVFENRFYGNGPLVKMNSYVFLVFVPLVYFVFVTVTVILVAVLVDQGVRWSLGYTMPGTPKISQDDLRFNSARNEKLMFGLTGLIGTGLAALLIAEKIKYAKSVLSMVVPAIVWTSIAVLFISTQR